MEKLNDRWVHESELCDYARSENIECLFAYERDINPLCYFIFVRTNREKLRTEKFIDDRKLSGEFISGRVIEVVNLGAILSPRWIDDIFRRSIKHKMLRDDFMILVLVFIFTQTTSGSFVKMNAVHNFGDNLSDEQLQKILSGFMKSHGYKLRLSSIKCNRKKIMQYQKFTLTDWCVLIFMYAKKKIRRLSDIYKNAMNNRDMKRFANFIDEKFSLSGNYILEKGNFAFIAAEVSCEKIFIKGTESSKRIAILENEVNAQKKLSGLNDEAKNLFVCMKDFCLDEMKYIVYPFVKGFNIGEYYGQGKRFNASELKELGEFLLNVLEILNELGIIHRDLRPENIMFIPEDRFKFRVIDFGCAYSGGMNRISFDDRFDKLCKGGVCSDFKYFEGIADDAASAYRTYIFCGGALNDEYAMRLHALIGRRYIKSKL